MFIEPPHDQQIHFDNGTTRWIRSVVKIEQSNWFHIINKDGVEHIINPQHILFIKVYKTNGKRQKIL